MPVLPLPQACQPGRGAQFAHPGILPLRDAEALAERRFGRLDLPDGEQQLTFPPLQFRLRSQFPPLRPLDRFLDKHQSFSRPPRIAQRFGQQGEVERNAEFAMGRTVCRHALLHDRHTFGDLTQVDQSPAPENSCRSQCRGEAAVGR